MCWVFSLYFLYIHILYFVSFIYHLMKIDTNSTNLFIKIYRNIQLMKQLLNEDIRLKNSVIFFVLNNLDLKLNEIFKQNNDEIRIVIISKIITKIDELEKIYPIVLDENQSNTLSSILVELSKDLKNLKNKIND